MGEPRRRGTVGLSLFGLALVLLGGAAQAIVARAPSSFPVSDEVFSTPNARIGDRASYEVSTVAEPASPPAVGGEEELVQLSWTLPAPARDGRGRVHHAARLDLLTSPSGDGGPRAEASAYLVDDGRPFARLVDARAPGETTSLLTRTEEAWSQRKTIYLNDEEPFPFCGLHHAFQGSPRTVADGLDLGPCRLGSEVLRATHLPLLDSVGTDSDRRVRFGDDESFEVILAPMVPYPIQMLVPIPTPQPALVRFRLIAFTPGESELPYGVLDEPLPPPASHVVRNAWGVEGPPMPFPLERAFAAARDDVLQPALRDFLVGHPQAVVVRAANDGETRTGHGTSTVSWTFEVSDATAAIRICVHREAPLGLAAAETIASWPCGEARTVDPSRLPHRLPEPSFLVALWHAFTGETGPANLWAFESTEEGSLHVTVGRRVHVVSPIPGFIVGGGQVREEVSTLTADESGHAVEMRFAHQQGDVRLAPAGPLAAAAPTPFVAAKNQRGASEFPTHLQAGIVVGGILAVLVAAASWIGGSLRGSSLACLFTRVKAAAALDHPVRARMLDRIKERPGIHFSELLRAAQAKPGVAEHHLRKLVQLGFVTKQVSPGFTCYFAKGQVHRRLMDSAPALKSRAARSILAAIIAEPGLPLSRVAERTRQYPSAVTYHAKRLGASALLSVVRGKGRALLFPTPLGWEAVGGSAACRP